jgi:hypothetical protein
MTDEPKPPTRRIKLTPDDELDPQSQIIVGLIVQVLHQLSEIKAQVGDLAAQVGQLKTQRAPAPRTWGEKFDYMLRTHNRRGKKE